MQNSARRCFPILVCPHDRGTKLFFDKRRFQPAIKSGLDLLDERCRRARCASPIYDSLKGDGQGNSIAKKRLPD
jgi:hypothetical protein